MDSFFPSEPRPYSAYAPVRPVRQPKKKAWQIAAEERDLLPTTSAGRQAEIDRIAHQLAKITETVPWGRVQNNLWDGRCHFIFRLRTADSVRARASVVADEQNWPRMEFVHYALRRWYCFWGARIAEMLFHEYPNVVAGPPKDHDIDFSIDGVPFDLKTSELPSRYIGRISELVRDPEPLASWFYAHQSRERRFHLANRLFIVLCDPEEPGEAWQLRADVGALRAGIETFMRRPRFLELHLPDSAGEVNRVVTAVIPVLRLSAPRQLRLAFGTDGIRGESSRPAIQSTPDRQLGLPLDL